MRTQTQATPQAPDAPLAPPAGATIVTGSGSTPITIQVPQTDAQVYALVSRRDQLSSQIQDAMDRRQSIVAQIPGSPDGVSRTGLEQQVSLLDERIMAMEKELAATEAQLALAPADLIAFAERDSRPPQATDRLEMFALTGFIAVVAIVIYRTAGRWFRKSRRTPVRATALPVEATERLERLEHGMESIAIEVERISEGQRFVTKLLAENRSPDPVLQRNEK
jgi:hypothetical protein